MEQDKKHYALYINAETIRCERDLSGRALVRIVAVGEDRKIRNAIDTEFDNLALYCQWTDGLNDGKPFAFTVEYRDVYSVDASRAKRMVKLFRKLERVEKNMVVQPTTFGQFCVLMARGLGLTELVKRVDGQDKYVGMDEGDYRHFSLTEAQYVIDQAIVGVEKEQVSA